jgi:hypothetical protein
MSAAGKSGKAGRTRVESANRQWRPGSTEETQVAKQKKAARKAPRAAVPAKLPAVTAPGRKFAVVKTVTLPVLALKIEVPVYVTFRGTPRPQGDETYLLEVLELETETIMDLEVPAKLAAAIKSGYTGEGDDNPLIERKSFCIIRHAAHARKNAYGYTVEEIDPTKPAEGNGGAAS